MTEIRNNLKLIKDNKGNYYTVYTEYGTKESTVVQLDDVEVSMIHRKYGIQTFPCHGVEIKNDEQISSWLSNNDVDLTTEEGHMAFIKWFEEIYCTVYTKYGIEELTQHQWYGLDQSEVHRTDGPAVEFVDGTKRWCQNGELHREDGPAVEFTDGTKIWFQNGKRHRIDGPAAEYGCGEIIWALNGQDKDTGEVFKWLLENHIDLSEPEGQMAYKLRWS